MGTGRIGIKAAVCLRGNVCVVIYIQWASRGDRIRCPHNSRKTKSNSLKAMITKETLFTKGHNPDLGIQVLSRVGQLRRDLLVTKIIKKRTDRWEAKGYCTVILATLNAIQSRLDFLFTFQFSCHYCWC